MDDEAKKMRAFIDAEHPMRTITFRVDAPNLPEDEVVHITGNHTAINGWTSFVPLKKGADGIWTIDLLFESGTELEYKFTLGCWPMEALTDAGEIPPNSILIVTDDELVNQRILMWKGL